MKKYLYEAILTPTDDGRYDAQIPELDIYTFGDDLADAAFMAQDALTLAVSSLLADGVDVPTVGSFSNKCPKGSTLMGIATFAEAGALLEDTMTVQEAADVLGVTRSRVYTMIKNKTLSSTMVGNQRLVSAADVMERFNNPRHPGRPAKTEASETLVRS